MVGRVSRRVIDIAEKKTAAFECLIAVSHRLRGSPCLHGVLAVGLREVEEDTEARAGIS